MSNDAVRAGAIEFGSESNNSARLEDAATSLRQQFTDLLSAQAGSLTASNRLAKNDATATTKHDHIALPNAFGATSSDGTSKNAAATNQPDTAVPRAKWTLAFNLTTTMDEMSDFDSSADSDIYVGARRKTEQLLQLSQSTRNKVITLVVQDAEPGPAETKRANATANGPGGGDPHSDKLITLNFDQMAAADKTGSDDSNNMLVHTYIIRNGQIDQLPDRPSAGVAKDTQELLALAGRQAPSDHLALFSQSHGGGPGGISGNTGEASLDALSKTIKDGLTQNGREQLDLLDFDACSMGNAKVLSAMAGLSKQIIASSETEGANAHADGQNIQAIAQTVLNRPEINPADLANQVINLADQGANADQSTAKSLEATPGTLTLAQYDSAKIMPFNHSLDNLGTALSRAWENPGNRMAIQKAIQDSPQVSSAEAHMDGRPDVELRDSRTFAQNILQAVDRGALPDQDGSLKGSAKELLRAQEELVLHYHGEHRGGYDRQGGISLFLPGQDFLNSAGRKRETEAAALMAKLADTPKLAHLNFRNTTLDKIDELIAESKRSLGSQFDHDFEPLKESRSLLAQAQNEEQYQSALINFSQQAVSFEQTDAGRLLARQALERAENRTDHAINEQLDTATPNWNQFLKTLGASAR